MAIDAAETGKGRDAAGKASAAGAAPSLHGLPPLMAHSTAAAMAASAVGLGIANQMAGAWLGMMRGALEAGIEMAEALGVTPEGIPAEPAAAAPATARPAETAAPAAPAPVVKVARVKTKGTPPAPAPVAKVEPARAEPAKVGKRAGGDDLKRIAGIGPKLETMLKARGIRRYGDLVALGAEGLARLDAELKLDGRSARDGWLDAARALVPGRRKT